MGVGGRRRVAGGVFRAAGGQADLGSSRDTGVRIDDQRRDGSASPGDARGLSTDGGGGTAVHESSRRVERRMEQLIERTGFDPRDRFLAGDQPFFGHIHRDLQRRLRGPLARPRLEHHVRRDLLQPVENR